jgi:hypothetical protein
MRLHDQFQQTWRETLHNCSKTLNYCIFKETFIFEQYFDILDEMKICVYQIYEKSHSSKIVFILFNQEKLHSVYYINGTLNDTQQSKFLIVFLL